LVQLHQAKHACTLKLALHLMQRRFILKCDTIVLSTVALKDWGINWRGKSRALAELEQLGLIRIEHRRPKSPVVYLQHTEELPPSL